MVEVHRLCHSVLFLALTLKAGMDLEINAGLSCPHLTVITFGIHEILDSIVVGENLCISPLQSSKSDYFHGN